MNPVLKLALKFYGTGLSRIGIVNKLNMCVRSKLKPETINFYGNTIFLDKYDMNQLSVLGQQGKDYHEINFIIDKIKEGDNAVDVGANIGVYTVLFSNWVGRTGKVWSIEPATDNCELIYKTIKANKIDNVSIIQKAVTNNNGTDLLDTSSDPTGYHLTKRRSKSFEMVNCIRLDDFFTNQKIDFVKIDAEGQELNVLKGMPKLLQQPDIKLMLEFEPENFSDENNPIEILEILESNDFEFTDLARNGNIQKITKKELLTRTKKRPDLYKNIYCERRK